jgi:hypothetical protein
MKSGMGEFPIYSELLEEYIFDDGVIDEQLEEHGRTFDDLLVVKCKPNHVRPIDPDDYCYDDLPDDKDDGAPNEVVEAAEKFNEAVKDVVLSYSPTDIMLTWSHQKLDTDHTPEVEIKPSIYDSLTRPLDMPQIIEVKTGPRRSPIDIITNPMPMPEWKKLNDQTKT